VSRNAGADIQEHEITVLAFGFEPVFLRVKLKIASSSSDLFSQHKGIQFSSPAGCSFLKGCPCHVSGIKYPCQPWMTIEVDTKHVIHLTFIPVG